MVKRRNFFMNENCRSFNNNFGTMYWWILIAIITVCRNFLFCFLVLHSSANLLDSPIYCYCIPWILEKILFKPLILKDDWFFSVWISNNKWSVFGKIIPLLLRCWDAFWWLCFVWKQGIIFGKISKFNFSPLFYSRKFVLQLDLLAPWKNLQN